MGTSPTDDQLWADFVAAHTAYVSARVALLGGAQDLRGLIDRALWIPSQRGAALDVLELLPENRVREHLEALVDLVSGAQAYIDVVRSLILKMDRSWVVENIDAYAVKLLVS